MYIDIVIATVLFVQPFIEETLHNRLSDILAPKIFLSPLSQCSLRLLFRICDIDVFILAGLICHSLQCVQVCISLMVSIYQNERHFRHWVVEGTFLRWNKDIN